MHQVNINGYIRINKAKAKQLYCNSKEIPIYILPCKANPASMWITPTRITSRVVPFDVMVNNYEYYNCNPELGSYAAFYIKEGEVDG